MMRRRFGTAARGRRAFTLIEVLASLALVAIILPVAMKGISTAIQAAALARQRTEAASLAAATMAELIATGDLQDASAQGEYEDYPNYRWTADIAEWDGSTVQQLEVSVLWTARGQERAVTLDTLVFTPEN